MKTIELTEDQWKDVLALMEKGVCSLGYAAFVSGGDLMRQIVEQLQSEKQEN